MDDETQIREMEKDLARDAEEIRLLKGRVLELETELRQEGVRVDWLLARQYNHKTRESVDAVMSKPSNQALTKPSALK